MKIKEKTKSQKIRNLFKQNKIIYVMGAHNGLSAKLAEKNKFDAVWASGLEISASYAVPDANILTMTQNLEKSAEMSDAVNIPVIASGGVGTLDHLADGILLGKADAVLAASIFHFGISSARSLKEELAQAGVSVRLPC